MYQDQEDRYEPARGIVFAAAFGIVFFAAAGIAAIVAYKIIN